MTRTRLISKIPGHRYCNRCKGEFLASPENFIRDATRLLGLGYECRGCHSKRRAGRDRRTERWANLSPESKQKVQARQKRYWKTNNGRAMSLRHAYIRTDSCDLSVAEVAEIIIQPCTYCGTTERNRGLDRIDNAQAHIRGNVLPCCAPCNFARGDRLTVEEMKILGKAMCAIFDSRDQG